MHTVQHADVITHQPQLNRPKPNQPQPISALTEPASTESASTAEPASTRSDDSDACRRAQASGGMPTHNPLRIAGAEKERTSPKPHATKHRSPNPCYSLEPGRTHTPMLTSPYLPVHTVFRNFQSCTHHINHYHYYHTERRRRSASGHARNTALHNSKGQYSCSIPQHEYWQCPKHQRQ